MLTVLAASLFMGPIPIAASVACVESRFGMVGATCGQQLLWRYDDSSRTFVSEDRIVNPRDSGIRYDYQLNERCEEGVDCGAAVFTCSPSSTGEGRRYQSTAYVLLPGGSRADVPPIVTTVCVYPGRSVPLSVVEVAAHEEVRKRLSQPTVTSSPPGRSLVGLLTIFSTPAQPEPSIAITQPVPGEVRARPAYSWDFGDGLAGLGPGVPYQQGDVPSRLPGKYLGATYGRAGVKHVTLTVTWGVQFRLEGVLEVPLAPIVFTATQDKDVATARAVLVG